MPYNDTIYYVAVSNLLWWVGWVGGGAPNDYSEEHQKRDEERQEQETTEQSISLLYTPCLIQYI